MSSGTSAALALGLGAAGGAAIWYFTRDKKRKAKADKPPTATAPHAAGSAPPASSAPALPASATPPNASAVPPRVPGPCSLKIDKLGLTADGERVDVPTAIERCKVAGSVEWVAAPDAPAAVVVELLKAIQAAKLPSKGK